MNEGNICFQQLKNKNPGNEQLNDSKKENREYLKVEPKIITEENWRKFKEIRLDAFKNDPEAFRSKKIAKTLYERELEKTEQEWQDDLSDIENEFFVGAENPINKEEIISIAGAVKGETWRLIFVYTKKDFREKGVSKQVVGKVLKELKEKEVKKIYLYVRKAPKQEKAVKFYKELGFKTLDSISALKKYRLKSINWQAMELDLVK